MPKAKLVNLEDSNHNALIADILLDGGVVGSIWGHHLYFLAGNALDPKAIKKMNLIKGRPEGQVLASPGNANEAEEFGDLEKSKGLIFEAKKLGLSPVDYLSLLFKKFPLAVELYAKKNTPSTVTLNTEYGKTIWIAGHLSDKRYANLIDLVSSLRKDGKKIVFAGTSLNLTGQNTLTVRELDDVIKHFSDKVDAISVHPLSKALKKVRYGTSSSVVSFIHPKPRLIRVGTTSVKTLKKYIPDLEIPAEVKTTRKTH